METLAQSPAGRMVTKETPAPKAMDTAAPQRVPGYICASAIPKTFLTQDEIILAHMGLCSLLLPKDKMYPSDPSDFFPKGSVWQR